MQKQESDLSIPNEQSSISMEACSQNSTPVKNGANASSNTIENDDDKKKSSQAFKEPPQAVSPDWSMFTQWSELG